MIGAMQAIARLRPNVRVIGLVPAADSTALALVLTELVTNAVEHGLARIEGGGTVEISAQRDGQKLRVVVADDGVGMQAGSGASSGLGTQIVLTLVKNELRGKIEWLARDGGGTQVVLEVTLRDPPA